MPDPTHTDPTPTTAPQNWGAPIAWSLDTPATTPPAPKGPIERWYDRQSPLRKSLLSTLLGALLATVAPWLAPILRPPATAVDPAAPVAVQAQQGAAAASALSEIGLLEE